MLSNKFFISSLNKVLVVVLVTAISIIPSGCAVTMTEASASATLNLGFLRVDASAKWEKDESVDGLPGQVLSFFGKKIALSRAADNLYLDLSGQNASIPNQNGSVTVSISHNGSLVGARTFAATIYNEELRPDNTWEVEQWLSGFDTLEDGEIKFEANNISYTAPPEGYYTLTNKLNYGTQTLASASVTGYAGGGTPPWID